MTSFDAGLYPDIEDMGSAEWPTWVDSTAEDLGSSVVAPFQTVLQLVTEGHRPRRCDCLCALLRPERFSLLLSCP